ncbi:hypothetical protein ACO0OL_002739 [Hanseniaspora opuntiae]|jgi:TFIIH basal transcription factor complex TTD-A subunit
MARATKGTLIKCDPSIKQLIIKLNNENNNNIILQTIDNSYNNNEQESILLIDGVYLDFLKMELDRMLSKNIFEEEDEANP